MDEESGDDVDLVGSKQGDNNLHAGINGDTKGMEQIKELFIAALFSSTTSSVKEKLIENGDVPTTITTTTTTEEAIFQMWNTF